MKIFVEGHSYDPKDVERVLPDNRMLLSVGRVPIENVGYYRSPKCDDFVFFLPKVVLAPVKTGNGNETEDHAFCRKEGNGFVGGFRPEDLIDPETAKDVDGKPLSDDQRDFLCEFSVWIYRALARYRWKNAEGVAWSERNPGAVAARRRYETHTLLDVILAMQRFARENRDYVMYRVKEAHSGGRIDWRRTVAKSPAVVADGTPVYLELRNRRKAVDWDEELLVIFHSILAYVGRTFGFRERCDLRFDLVTGEAFERYLHGYGARRLRQIRYKYFSDRDLAMWRLCFAFFDKAHKADVSGAQEEYLLAKDFERVFETIVDDLLGDGELERFKELDDAKRIDHLYLDESLTRRTDKRGMFYIADSKYYKRGNRLGKESVAKQFTYARDFLQLDLDLFLSGDEASEKVRRERKGLEGVGLVRDPDTEGYDVIPNFFVSATLPDDLGYDADGLKEHDIEGAPGDGGVYRNIHFENRLFDRDTLILSHYDVNFLFLLKLYARNDGLAAESWRKEVRGKFRAHIQSILKDRFEFRAIMPYDGVTDDQARAFLRDHFPDVLGKVYSPYAQIDGKKVYSLALENPDKMKNDDSLTKEGFEARKRRAREENAATLRVIREAFYDVEVELGKDPTEALQQLSEKSVPIVTGIRKITDKALEQAVVFVPAFNSDRSPDGFRAGTIEAVGETGVCPVPAVEGICSDPGPVRMVVFTSVAGETHFFVKPGGTPSTKMAKDDVRAQYGAFLAECDKAARKKLPKKDRTKALPDFLTAAEYWVFKVETGTGGQSAAPAG